MSIFEFENLNIFNKSTFFQHGDSFGAEVSSNESANAISTILDEASTTPDLKITNKRARTAAKTPVRGRIQTRATTAKNKQKKTLEYIAAANKNKIRRFNSIENVSTETN